MFEIVEYAVDIEVLFTFGYCSWNRENRFSLCVLNFWTHFFLNDILMVPNVWRSEWMTIFRITRFIWSFRRNDLAKNKLAECEEPNQKCKLEFVMQCIHWLKCAAFPLKLSCALMANVIAARLFVYARFRCFEFYFIYGFTLSAVWVNYVEMCPNRIRPYWQNVQFLSSMPSSGNNCWMWRLSFVCASLRVRNTKLCDLTAK